MKRIILLVLVALLLTGCRANNTSSVVDEAGAEMIKETPLTLELNEYGNFEKVGALPQSREILCSIREIK